jgi:hypothetical protein
MLWAVIVLAVVTYPVSAMLRATFSVEFASWYATNIVVVETTPIDGTFEVLESWKGDLPVGSQLVVPELIPPTNAIPISRYPKWWTPEGQSGIAEQIPKQPVGSRIVLFLKRNEIEPTARDGRKKRDWSGSSRDDDDMYSMKISTVWIEGDKTYSFEPRGSTSSPLVLSVRGVMSKEDRRFVEESEEDLRRGVAGVLKVQEDMKAVISETNGRERALRLKSYANSKMYPARQSALEELGKAGPSAVSTIGEMWDDPAFADESRELIRAMVQAGGDAAGSELNRRLEGDLAYWKYAGPSLSPGWWNKDPGPESAFQARYNRTCELIHGLEQAKYAGALNTAIQMRDLWLTLPPSDPDSEQNQIVEECDKLIALLQTVGRTTRSAGRFGCRP